MSAEIIQRMTSTPSSMPLIPSSTTDFHPATVWTFPQTMRTPRMTERQPLCPSVLLATLMAAVSTFAQSLAPKCVPKR